MILVHNPTAGDQAHDGKGLVEIIEAAGFQVRYQSSKKGWKKALREPADLIVAAGGDGTLASVLRRAAGGQTPVALLPLGTANNIGRALRLLGEVEQVVRGWAAAERSDFDLGAVRWPGGQSSFVESCGGGALARAVEQGKERVEESAEFAGHEMDRSLAFVRQQLAEARAEAWQVELDGRDLSGDFFGVEVLNIRFVGPSIPLAPEADPADGLLDVVLIGSAEREALLEYLDRRLHDSAAEAPALPVQRGRHIVLAPKRGTLRIDDELVDSDKARKVERRFEISVHPGAVPVLVPRR